MDRRMNKWLLVCVLILLSTPAAAHAPQSHGFELTTFRRPPPAPELLLTTPTGAPVTLKQFRGRVVLLNFWATWCPPCVKEMPSMEALYRKFKAEGLSVLAISLDVKGAAVVVPFLKKYKLTFPVALDPESNSSKVYGASNLPSSFLVDRQGRVIAAALGERDWFSPNAISYLDEVLKKNPKKPVITKR